MNRTKYLQGPCQACGTMIRFPAESIGLTAACPHCKKPTELVLGTPDQARPGVPRKVIAWTLAASVILGGGLVGSLIALHRAQAWAARHQPRSAQSAPVSSPEKAEPDISSAPLPFGLQTSAITLRRTSGRLFVVGSLSNRSNQRHSGVKIEIDLLDASGSQVGTATAYKRLIAPGTDWQFEVPAPVQNAASARVASITEGQ